MARARPRRPLDARPRKLDYMQDCAPAVIQRIETVNINGGIHNVSVSGTDNIVASGGSAAAGPGGAAAATGSAAAARQSTASQGNPMVSARLAQKAKESRWAKIFGTRPA